LFLSQPVWLLLQKLNVDILYKVMNYLWLYSKMILKKLKVLKVFMKLKIWL